MKNLICTILMAFTGLSAFAHDGHDLPGFTHLTFQGGALHAHATWEKGPQTPDESILRIEWKNGATHAPTEPPGTFVVSLFMTEMGHSSAPTRQTSVNGTDGKPLVGVFRVSGMYFTMGGKWEVRVTLKPSSGVEETKVIAVDLGDGTHHHDKPLSNSGSTFLSPALDTICADGVTPHPKWPGYWHIDRPRFAVSGQTLFATMDLRPTADGEYVVVRVDPDHSANYTEVIRFKDPINDIAIHDDKIWVLFRDRVVSVDAINGAKISEVQTTQQALPSEDYQAYAFTWSGDRLIIAHGAYGMMAYDSATQTITRANSLDLAVNGQLSKAIDVTPVKDGQVAFAIEAITVSNQAPFTFNGIILMDVSSQSVVGRFLYDRASSGVLSNAVMKVSGDDVIINNWGILQRASLSGMKQTGSVRVGWTPVHFNINGKNESGELLGKTVLDKDLMISCAQVSYQDPQNGKIIHKGLVYSGAH